MNIERIVEQLKKDEGFSPQSFFDVKQWSWGHGTKAPGPGAFISKADADLALRASLSTAVDTFSETLGSIEMCETRQGALVNLIYNVGETSFRKFHDLIAAVRAQDWPAAAAAVKDSLYYRQLSKPNNGKEERAERIVREILEG